MDTKQISLIGIRLIAIYLIAQGISALPNIYLLVSTYDPSEEYTLLTYGSIVIGIISPILVGALVWAIASKLNSYVVSGLSEQSSQEKPAAIQIQLVAISLIGLYLLASSLPYVISINYQLFTQQDLINDNPTFNKSILINALSINLKALLGIALIIGSQRISASIVWLRRSGT